MKAVFNFGAALVFMLALTNCSKKSEPLGNVLRSFLKDDVKTLDPANAYDSVSLDVLPHLIEAPLQYSYTYEVVKVEPLIADGLPEFSKDGKSVTLKIKKGLFFHDDPCFKATAGQGRELTIHDFVFAFKRLAVPAIQSNGMWIFDGKIVGYSEFAKKLQAVKKGVTKEEFSKVFDEAIPGFVVKDDYTLEFKLTQAYPLLKYILAMTFTAPVAKEALEMYGDSEGNLRDHPVGTGPFMLKSWETNQRLIAVKNPKYKGVFPTEGSDALKAAGLLVDAGKPLPMLDEIRFEILKEDMPRFLQFQSGSLDRIELTKDSFASGMIDGDTLRPELAEKGVRAISEDTLVNYYVGFNMKDKVLQNKFLRQAISSVIDRQKWMDTFAKFRSKQQFEVAPPGLQDRTGATKFKYDFNVKRAADLLAKAGFPEGKGLPVLNFDFRGADTRYRQMGEMFVQQLGAIGIKVNVILNTFPAYLEKAKQGNVQIFFGGWNYDYPDVENGYQLLYGPNESPGPNDSNWTNPAYDALYKQMAVMPAGAAGRAAIIRKMEDLVQEECPWAYGYFERIYNLVGPRVKNARVAEIIGNRFKYLRVENMK